MERFNFVFPKTQGEARMYGIEWQNWASEQDLSWDEIAMHQNNLYLIAREFDLTHEFKENGLI